MVINLPDSAIDRAPACQAAMRSSLALEFAGIAWTVRASYGFFLQFRQDFVIRGCHRFDELAVKGIFIGRVDLVGSPYDCIPIEFRNLCRQPLKLFLCTWRRRKDPNGILQSYRTELLEFTPHERPTRSRLTWYSVDHEQPGLHRSASAIKDVQADK
jgi:hypothetical protein